MEGVPIAIFTWRRRAGVAGVKAKYRHEILAEAEQARASGVAVPSSLETSPVGYSFYAVLYALPQIAAAALVPPTAIVLVALLLRWTKPKSPLGIDQLNPWYQVG